ncbi:uncharacterized protein LOC124459363 [Xenia sp. Carnegie-2017]|uniref:uncharacterized protein LOC124459363 n=1 Tax=Xenia sp. Carnegie-2017 TaxID=2897299 RepID=UPI001F03F156|nr:uncharacterized protein LOC124459363 [Xenia sp. Carnegie-2017]
MLVKHLQNLEDPIVDIFQFSIPIFHCYGHVGRCQVKFSPCCKEGFGLTDEEEDWKCKYVIYLDLYADLYHRWNGCIDPSELTVRFNQVKKIDEQLKIMERENSISASWQNTDSEYENAKREVASRKEKRVLSRMRKNVAERWFLLNLKSK